MGLFSLKGVGNIIQSVGKVADDLFTSKEEKLKIALQERELEYNLVKGQQKINKQEAQHRSVFVAGWRPFIGWVGGLALAYQFIIYPLLNWALILFTTDIQPPPVIDSSQLYPVILGMLGIGGMRSFDKVKKVDTKSLK